MRRTLATSLAVALVLLAPAAAHASSTSKSDPNDTEMRLDVKKVSLKTQGKKIVATVATYDAFSNDDLTGSGSFGVDFKVSKTKVRGIAIRAADGDLYANVCTYKAAGGGDPNGTHCSKVSVKRVSSTSVQITVARAKVDKGAKAYHWRGGAFAMDGVAGCDTQPFCLDSTAKNATQYHLWKV